MEAIEETETGKADEMLRAGDLPIKRRGDEEGKRALLSRAYEALMRFKA
jgi:hypothetical protein